VLHVPCYLRPLTATHQPAHLSFTSTGEALPPTQRSWELSRLSFLCFLTAGSLLLRLLGGSGCSAVRRLRLWPFSEGVLSSRPRLISCSLRLPSAYAIRLTPERTQSHQDTKAPMIHVSTARLPCKSQSTLASLWAPSTRPGLRDQCKHKSLSYAKLSIARAHTLSNIICSVEGARWRMPQKLQ